MTSLRADTWEGGFEVNGEAAHLAFIPAPLSLVTVEGVAKGDRSAIERIPCTVVERTNVVSTKPFLS